MREDVGGFPVEPVPRSARRARPQVAPVACAQVVAPHASALGFGVDEVRIFRVDTADETVAAADRKPVLVDRPPAAARAVRPAPASVVLQTAVDIVIRARIDGDMVELTDRHLVELVPLFHPVVSDIDPAVGTEDDVFAVARIDPHRVVIGVHAAAAVAGEGDAAVLGAVERDAEDVHVVGIGGVDADLAEIHGPRIERVDTRPRLAAVFRFVDTAELVSFRTLLVLNVFPLAAQSGTEGAIGPRSGRWGDFCFFLCRVFLRRVFFSTRPLGKGDLLDHALVIAGDLDLHRVVGKVLADLCGQVLVGVNRVVLDGKHDVADLEPCLFRRTGLGDLGEARAHLDVLAADTDVGGVLRLLADTFRFDHGKDHVRFGSVVLQIDAAQVAAREAVCLLLEGLSPVGRQVDAGARSPLLGRIVGVESVALSFVGRGEDRVGCARLQLHIDNAGLVVDVEDLVPRLAAVDCLEETPLLVRPPESAKGAHVNDVGVFGVDRDAADLKGFGQSHVGPRLSAVDRFVDTVAPRDTVARIRFARADPDDFGVGWSHGHVSDRHGALVVELVREGDAVVGRLYQTARRSRRPPHGGIAFAHGERHDAAAHVGRSDAAPVETVDPLLWKGRIRSVLFLVGKRCGG